MDEILMNAEVSMENSIDNMEKRFLNIRAGRANPAMLDGIMVNYYGSDTPLFQKQDNYVLSLLIEQV